VQCRAHVSQLAKLYDKIQKADAEVIVILGDTLEKAKSYADLLKLPFPVLSDSQREVYRAYELGKYFFLIQRTASIVVDREGRVQYLKQAVNPMIWLQESRELMEFVESMNHRQ
jgi:thioredoxin-dependent peroxiredoxin